ncbi:MAG TPA: hypothetical protein VFF79_14035 [Conexibacter sp.]|jgi:hypothetical protein|nr:hypothetical protein [Conexibacter sp.]
MANAYALTVVNKSQLQRPRFAVFASMPVKANYESVSLAWFVQEIDATNQYTFRWGLEWAFVWSAEGTDATAGVAWQATGSRAADPDSASTSAVAFEYDGGDFTFRTAEPPQGLSPDGSTLWILDEPRVPTPSVKPSSVGVSLEGRPVCVLEAGPNLRQTFTLHPTYYIDAGNYVPGQMVDGADLTAFQKLEYAHGVTALTATLNPDNTWTVAPTA